MTITGPAGNYALSMTTIQGDTMADKWNADAAESLVQELRSVASAYPLDVFKPITDEERVAHAMLITRCSAAMGRHLGRFMIEAADALEEANRYISEASNSARACADQVQDAWVVLSQVAVALGAPYEPHQSYNERIIERADRLSAYAASLETALRHIAITDDADCAHAEDAEAMTRIARNALANNPKCGAEGNDAIASGTGSALTAGNNQSPSAPQQAPGSGPDTVSVEEAGSRAVETKQDSCAQGPDNDRRGAPDSPLGVCLMCGGPWPTVNSLLPARKCDKCHCSFCVDASHKCPDALSLGVEVKP